MTNYQKFVVIPLLCLNIIVWLGVLYMYGKVAGLQECNRIITEARYEP